MRWLNSLPNKYAVLSVIAICIKIQKYVNRNYSVSKFFEYLVYIY